MEENVREKERARSSERATEKIRLLFSARARERESFRGFSAAKNRERRSRWCCACGRSRALLSAVRVLRVHARSRVKKQGFFSRVSDFFLGKHTTKERDTFLVIF